MHQEKVQMKFYEASPITEPGALATAPALGLGDIYQIDLSALNLEK